MGSEPYAIESPKGMIVREPSNVVCYTTKISVIVHANFTGLASGLRTSHCHRL